MEPRASRVRPGPLAESTANALVPRNVRRGHVGFTEDSGSVQLEMVEEVEGESPVDVRMAPDEVVGAGDDQDVDVSVGADEGVEQAHAG